MVAENRLCFRVLFKVQQTLCLVSLQPFCAVSSSPLTMQCHDEINYERCELCIQYIFFLTGMTKINYLIAKMLKSWALSPGRADRVL